MKIRGDELNRTYKKLPGISIKVHTDRCNGCGICADKCYLGEMRMTNGLATVSIDCKACGMCIDHCPEHAIELIVDDEQKLYSQLKNRVEEMSDIKYGFDK